MEKDIHSLYEDLTKADNKIISIMNSWNYSWLEEAITEKEIIKKQIEKILSYYY